MRGSETDTEKGGEEKWEYRWRRKRGNEREGGWRKNRRHKEGGMMEQASRKRLRGRVKQGKATQRGRRRWDCDGHEKRTNEGNCGEAIGQGRRVNNKRGTGEREGLKQDDSKGSLKKKLESSGETKEKMRYRDFHSEAKVDIRPQFTMTARERWTLYTLQTGISPSRTLSRVTEASKRST